MNKKNLIYIFLIILIIILSGIIVINSINKNKNKSTLSPIIIYKTKGDYFNLVSAKYSFDDGLGYIIDRPFNQFTNFEKNNVDKIIYKYNLDNNYVLDYSIFDMNIAFLDTTYEDYNTIEEPLIKDNDPFLEFYKCDSLKKEHNLFKMNLKNDFVNICLKNKNINLDIYKFNELYQDYYKKHLSKTKNNIKSLDEIKLLEPIITDSQNTELLEPEEYIHEYLYLQAKHGNDIMSCKNEYDELKKLEISNSLDDSADYYNKEFVNYINEYIINKNLLEEKCVRLK